MKICFCSIAFRDETIEAILPRLAELRYDAVEIWGRHIEGYDDSRLDALREQARSLRLGIEVLSPYLWLTQTEELRQESLRIAEHFVRYARRLGCPKIRTFTDSGPTGIGSAAATPAQRSVAVATLKQITAMAPEVRFVVETHPKTLADTSDSMLRLLDEVAAPNLSVLYQPTAATLFEGYERLRPHIEHLHIQNETPNGEHAWVEAGCMDLRRFLRRLAEDGYANSLSVEYCWKGVPWDRAATARAFVAECLTEIERKVP